MKFENACCFFVVVFLSFDVRGQDNLLMRQLKASENLKTIMKPDSADMGFKRWQNKVVNNSRVLPLAIDFASLKLKGPGTLKVDKTQTISGQGSVVLDAPSSLAVKNPSNRSYAFAEMIRPLKKMKI